jgi:hypothetical protein
LVLLGILLTMTVTYALAEEITLPTYYSSPRGVYDQVQANIYRDQGNPTNRFLDPNSTSQLQSVQFAPGSSVTVGGQSITSWEQAIPTGSVLMFTTVGCPAGFTQLGGADLGRFPVVFDTPGLSGGDFFTDDADALTVTTSGLVDVAAETHRHPFTPPYKEFIFCQRN